MPNPIISSLKKRKINRPDRNKKALSAKGLFKVDFYGNYPPIEIRLNSFTVSVFAASAKS